MEKCHPAYMLGALNKYTFFKNESIVHKCGMEYKSNP
jgi:hypothetical protein